MADIATTVGGAAQPTQDHNTAPGGTGMVPATTTSQPLYAGETPAMQAARERNAAMAAAQTGEVLNTKAGQTTIGDLYAQGVRDPNKIGSYQNVGDNGTGGTSLSTTGTGTIAKDENIRNPIPLGTQEAINLQNAQTNNQPYTPPQQSAPQQSSAPVDTRSDSERIADMQYASEIRSAANTFGTKLDSFIGSFKNDMGEFLNNQTNSYQSLVDQMSTFMQAQTGELKALSDRQIQTWDNYAKMFEVEKNAAIADTNQNASKLTDFARLDEQMALKQNDLARQQSAAQYSDQIAVAQENQARYQGFLVGKFDAAGMANSSAGVQLIGKYLAAGQAQINGLQRDADYAQQMYIAKGTEIMNGFAKQAFQIEVQRQQETRQLRNEANEKIMQIESNKFASQEKKIMDIYAITKDYNAMVMDAKSKAFSEVMQVKDQQLKEAQFSQKVIMDQIQTQQWEKTFELSKHADTRASDELNSSMSGFLYIGGQVAQDKNGNPVRTLQGMNYDQQKDKFMSDTTGEVYINGQATGKSTMAMRELNQRSSEFDRNFAQGQYEFDQTLQLNRDKFDSETQQQDFERSVSITTSNLANNPAFAKFLSPEDVIGMGGYVSEKDGSVTSLGEMTANALRIAAKNTDSAFQCVQFARAIVPDLPSGLFSLADKIQSLTKGTNSLEAPAPGAVVVLDWKTPQEKGKSSSEYAGHVAVVKSVDEKNRTFTIVDYNGSGGKYKLGEKTIKMDNSAVKGYWMSPNIQNNGGSNASTLARDMMNPYSQLKLSDIPEKQRGAVSMELSKLKNEAMKGNDAQAIVKASAGGKSLDTASLQKLTQAQNVQGQLDALEKSISATTTGPIMGIASSNNPYDTKVQQVKAQLKSIVPQLARGIYGEVGVLTDHDIENYSQTIPNVKSTDALNKILAQATRDLVNKSISNTLTTAARAGYDVSGFADIVPASVKTSTAASQSLQDYISSLLK